jgi:hypothetical protein
MAARNRYCPTGNHMPPAEHFRITDGKYARDCLACEEQRRRGALRGGVRRGFDQGHPYDPSKCVDIDRIHYIRGAVKGAKRKAA